MTWEYGLIGLVVGVIVGVVITRFGSRKLRDQHALQYELEKTKDELKEFKQELNGHFVRSAELLENMSQNYQELYQHMSSTTKVLLPEQTAQSNPFVWQQTSATHQTDESLAEMPRDYSEKSSGLLRSTTTDK
ncbi:Z-ring associated protein ZapG [Rosenbergiella australiborealis]|uniref:Z-ring associated protein G n=1 Tax=Rosenbergiella australiborealis TaxID=1544696 RepID=A0ABS5T495_9GAMM|nr:Z-ring associated protein ZapG [Rosenbergiella australiborealis]MBT0725818.1 DUF1043 family protein [Rosenbergiella australiborealis]